MRSKTIEKTFEISKGYVGIMSGAHLGSGDLTCILNLICLLFVIEPLSFNSKL